MDPAVLASLTIYNLPPAPPLWDSVGIFYITFCATWTAIVFAGMAFLWFNRNIPILKLRGLPLAFGSIIFLHLYWIMAQITYPIGRTMPVVIAYDVQYFVMGIWLPLGIALFHASNSRFLHVAKLQRLHFTGSGGRIRRGCNGGKTSWLCRFRNMDYGRRIIIFICIGIVAQVLLTVGMWVACKKYHPTFGIPGTEIRGSNLMEQLIDLGRGWEWWPTVLWQAIWTWIVAPTLIWRAWEIRDTMGWRTQTVGCCLSSLHATPMFMIASYVPAFEKINGYFTPSQWIHLSTMMFEIFTIFVPLVQVVRLRILTKHVTDANAKWESSSQTTTVRSSTRASFYGQKRAVSSSEAEKGQTMVYYVDSSEMIAEPDSRLLTMTALEHALRENQSALQEFSALSDFSGENIAFLGRVSEWKSKLWPNALPDAESLGSLSHEEILDAYNGALDIYADFISLQHAEFPLNLPSQELKHLFQVFDKPARILFGDDTPVNSATPFDDAYLQGCGGSRSGSSGSVHNHVRYTGDIPAGFDSSVFDHAQGHIKYLVLTNTWPKFVREMHQRRRSGETNRSINTTESESSLLSRVSSGFSSLFRSVKAI